MSVIPSPTFVLAAKLGRRSRKMRDMIHEATRTIEDSQTAQALHGLLSLKSPGSSLAISANAAPTTIIQTVGPLGDIRHVQVQNPGGTPVHVVPSVDGRAVEVSEVPPAITTVVVSSTTSTVSSTQGIQQGVTAQALSTTVAASIVSPSQTLPVTTAADGSASMVQLLLRMQSQANASLVSKKSTITATSTNKSSHPIMESLMARPVEVKTQSKAAVSASTASGILMGSVRQQSAKSGMFSTTASKWPKSLSQLSTAVTQSQPIQCQPSQKASTVPVAANVPSLSTGSVPRVFLVDSGDIQLLAPTLPMQLVQTGTQKDGVISISPQKSPRLSTEQGNKAPQPLLLQAGSSAQPIILTNSQDSLPIVSSPGPNPAQSRNISDANKRSSVVMVDNSTPAKMAKIAPNLQLESLQTVVVSMPGCQQTIALQLPTSMVADKTEAEPKPVVSPPIALPSPQSSLNTELATVMGPLLAGGKDGPQSTLTRQDYSLNLIGNLRAGFEDTFCRVRNQVQELKESSHTQQTMKSVVDKVVTEQIAEDWGKSNVSIYVFLFQTSQAFVRVFVLLPML